MGVIFRKKLVNLNNMVIGKEFSGFMIVYLTCDPGTQKAIPIIFSVKNNQAIKIKACK